VEELLEKVCPSVLAISGIAVISLLLTERWWMPADDFFPDIFPIT